MVLVVIGVMAHIGLRATVGLAVVRDGVQADHCESCGGYSHTDRVVEVNERFRRFAVSPVVSSMYSQ